MSIYDYTATNIKGEEVSLEQFRNKVLLITNTATKCGFAPQFRGLQQLYTSYHEQGFEVLGFPCNQFGGQEPGEEQQISSVCELNYGVTFPLFAKVKVNGDQATPLFKYLRKAAPGIFGTEAIKWNFTKFLIDRQGNVIKRYAPADTPESIATDIQTLL